MLKVGQKYLIIANTLVNLIIYVPDNMISLTFVLPSGFSAGAVGDEAREGDGSGDEERGDGDGLVELGSTI